MTLDKLAQIIQKEFSIIYARLDKIERRLDNLENVADGLATKKDLEALEHRLWYKFDRRCELIEDRLKVIETALMRRKIIPTT